MTMQLPEYELVLPTSKNKVKYRPFTVKEEKILLMAREENETASIINAVNQIIKNCTFDKYNIDTLNKIDAEYLFINLRSKSKGEDINIKATCKKCGHKTPMTLNLTTATVKNADTKPATIKLSDNQWVTLRYPSIKESMEVSSDDDGTKAIALAIDSFIEGDSVKEASSFTLDEKIEFIESLTDMQLKGFHEFLDNFPVLCLDLSYDCKCGVKNDIHVEGLEDFFV